MRVNIVKNILKLLVITSILTLNSSCKENKEVRVTPLEVSFTKEGELTIYKAKTDSIIKTLDIEIADTEFDRETGLMYRSSMKPTQAMLFVFPDEMPRSFYMKNTQIGLDLLYIKADKIIESFQKYAKPMDESSLLSDGPAMYVLEINSGLADQWGLKVGDSISFTN
ncbi:DUF192 domain-containing protein [Formosa sp. S-31]|uniref:DUF192 domain-containing protein n=1 Tax=Formosa sp. S-31 TaxID=2790949 RepID=UPI003EB8B1E2